MQLIRDLSQADSSHPTVLTIGTFDGLHRGHQALIKQIKQAARRYQALAAVIAFHPRPKTVFAPHLFKNDYLTTAEERIHLFKQTELDILVLIPFTHKLAQTTAEDFMRLLKQKLNLQELWAGHDFALGKNREGTVPRLTELGHQFDYRLHGIEPFYLGDEIVSSTRIRHLFRQGKITQATELLGRYPFLTGEVARGAQRGRTIGFPTANLVVPAERLLPANGVYATYMEHLATGQRYPSVTNVGMRPSFAGQSPTIEAYIFDFEQNIYGERFRLRFVQHLRPEKKFADVSQLVAQIKEDAAQARAVLQAL